MRTEIDSKAGTSNVLVAVLIFAVLALTAALLIVIALGGSDASPSAVEAAPAALVTKVTPAVDETPAPTATHSPLPTPTAEPQVLRPEVTRALNLRSTPGGEIVQLLYPASQVLQVGEPSMVDATEWLPVETLDGQLGWAASTHLTPWQVGDSNRFLEDTLVALLGERHARGDHNPLELASFTATFEQYVASVNEGDLYGAFHLRSPSLNQQTTFPDFFEAMSSMEFSPFVLGDSVVETAGGAEVTAAFVSFQDPVWGFEGQTCSVWVVEYALEEQIAGKPLITGASTLDGTPRDCATVGIDHADLRGQPVDTQENVAEPVEQPATPTATLRRQATPTPTPTITVRRQATPTITAADTLAAAQLSALRRTISELAANPLPTRAPFTLPALPTFTPYQAPDFTFDYTSPLNTWSSTSNSSLYTPSQTQVLPALPPLQTSSVSPGYTQPANTLQTTCSSGYYVNVDDRCVRLPTPTNIGNGASARCEDGSFSYSQNRQGTCSHHGGVDAWLD